jgi:arylsulfatase A-like enzyme
MQLVVFFLCVLFCAVPMFARRPNVVLIVADDLGYGDIGSRLSTPNLDAMAKKGVRFTNAHTSHAVCTPSRASILTGRYPQRLGRACLLTAIMPKDDCGLPAGTPTMASMFEAAGYRTALVGKWHLGHLRPENSPTRFGFQAFKGVRVSSDMSPLWYFDGEEPKERLEEKRHLLTSMFTEKAVEFIAQPSDLPFFLVLAYTAPHSPLTPHPDYLGKSKFGFYGDMVAELDQGVGRVVQAVAERGEEQDTIFVFLSDNGPWDEGSAGGLRGRKFSTSEGGVRVPMFMAWPEKIEAGRVVSDLVSNLDLLPTLASLAGVSVLTEVDGVDLSPVLRAEKERVERTWPLLFFSSWEMQCAALGELKFCFERERDGLGPQAYHLGDDPEESYNSYWFYYGQAEEVRRLAIELFATFPKLEARASPAPFLLI